MTFPPHAILPAGTLLHHGTESASDFTVPKGPAWFGLTLDGTQRWAGWHSGLVHKGVRRILTYRTTVSLTLLNTCLLENWLRLADLLVPEEEPENASPYVVAARLVGREAGWLGQREVLLTNTFVLEAVRIAKVSESIRAYGEA